MNLVGHLNMKGKRTMNASTENEANSRLIELSHTISSLLETATTSSDITEMRDDVLRTVAESAEAARERIAQPSSEN